MIIERRTIFFHNLQLFLISYNLKLYFTFGIATAQSGEFRAVSVGAQGEEKRLRFREMTSVEKFFCEFILNEQSSFGCICKLF